MRTIKYHHHRKVSIHCGKYKLSLGDRTYIMGILNVTPDSFSDGGCYVNIDKAVQHAKEMVQLGADIIDIGGESTRPGAKPVNEKEEINRILPVVKRLVKEVDVPISVDTYKANVALKTLDAGAHIINDVWGLQKDSRMAEVVAQYKVPIIMMHNQKDTVYHEDIMDAMVKFFKHSIDLALKKGIEREQIILDPGIGFGKTLAHNIEIMGRLGELNDLGYPLLLGTSRKSLIGKTLNLESHERIEGTLATTTMGIIQGIDIIRVHDIKENVRTAKLTDIIVRGDKNG